MNFKGYIFFFISIIPFQFLKKFLINQINGYKVCDNSTIGYFNFISAKELTIKNSSMNSFNILKSKKINISNSKINNMNKIYNFKNFYISNRSIIGSKNIIKDKNKYLFNFLMKTAQISYDQNLYLNGGIILKQNVILGGIGTKIIASKDRGVTYLKKNVFIGSQTILFSGIEIASNVVIGAKSVIHSNIYNEGSYFTNKVGQIKFL